MSFKQGDLVTIRETGDAGVVEAQNVAHQPPRYLVSYTKDNGASYQDWFPEDLLEARQPAPAGEGREGAGSVGASESQGAGEAADGGRDAAPVPEGCE